ncbi:YkvA family protein [Luteolibacter algae]|uniref:YkvA family protein n=1 Tax=Luteolibacter algae TaxID=454151 RepID=A0ABW5DCW6_9BACT
MKFPKINKAAIKTHMPEAFSVSGFWLVIRKLSKKGGRKIMASALTLYYCMRDPETPAWAKSVILGALGYLIFPMDFIPDAILGAGFTDDWSVILGAMAAVVTHIKDTHKQQASELTDKILGGGDGDISVESPISVE